MYARAIDDYRRFLTAHGHPPGTIEQYAGTARRFLAFHGGSLETVTEQTVIDWLAHRDWQPNTRRKQVANLKGFWAWALATGRADHDPTGVLKPVRGAHSAPRPTPEDVYEAALEQAMPEDRWRLRLAAETGMRRAELAAVHSDHVARGVRGYVLWIDGKGRRQRHVPIPDDLARWVQAQHGYVFASTARPGEHMIPSAVGKFYRARLGGKWTTHTLRHRYGTRAYAQLHDIEAVRRLLGHDSVRTTQVYVATADAQLWAVAESAWGHGVAA